MKDIIKVIKSVENRGILLKETTGKINSQEVGFLVSLVRASLLLIKNVLKPVANVFVSLGLMEEVSTTDAFERYYSKDNILLITSNEEKKDNMEIVKYFEEYHLLKKRCYQEK